MNNLKNINADIKIIEDLSGLQEIANHIEVSNEQEAKIATEFLKAVKMRNKRIEEIRKEKVKPLNKEVKEINKNFKALKEFIDNIDINIKTKVINYNNEIQKKLQKEAEEKAEKERQRLEVERQKEIKRLEKERIEKEEKAETKKDLKEIEELKEREELVEDYTPTVEVKVEEAKKIKTDNAQQITRKRWVAEVIQEKDVPRDYLIVDQKLINRAVRNGVRNIEGVKIYQKEDLIIK